MLCSRQAQSARASMSRSSGLLSVAKHLGAGEFHCGRWSRRFDGAETKIVFLNFRNGVSSPGDAEPGVGPIARASSLLVSLSWLANWRIDEKEAKSLYVIE